MDLHEWTHHYIEYRDSYDGNLVKTTAKDNTIICQYKDKKVIYIVEPDLKLQDIQDDMIIVCLNTEKNVDLLVQRWDELIKCKLKIIFVNIDANEQWSLIPHIHNKFCDTENLKQGLMSLHDSVPAV